MTYYVNILFEGRYIYAFWVSDAAGSAYLNHALAFTATSKLNAVIAALDHFLHRYETWRTATDRSVVDVCSKIKSTYTQTP